MLLQDACGDAGVLVVSCIALGAGKVRSSGGDHSLKGSVVLHFRGVSQVGFNTKLLLGLVHTSKW